MPDEPKGVQAAPEDAAAWLKTVLEQASAPERQELFKKATRGFHEDEFAAVAKGHETSKREAARWKKVLDLDADSLANLTQAENLTEWAKGVAKSVGVPESVLKFAHTPAEVQEAVTDHLAQKTGGEGASPAKGGSLDFTAQVKAALETLGVKPEAPAPKGEALPSGTARGGVTKGINDYQEQLRSGKSLPSPREIDRMVAERFG